MATIYNINTGFIRVTNLLPEDDIDLLLSQCTPEEQYILGNYDSDNYYIVEGNPIIRDMLPITHDKDTITINNIDKVIFTNIPNNTSMYWYHNELYDSCIITDGSLSFSTDLIGEHKFAFVLFPFKSLEVTINAVN